MAKCSNTMQNAKCPCQNAANTMQQVLVPNCCEYKANGTGKESQKKNQNLKQKKIQKLYYTLVIYLWQSMAIILQVC
jgi:hypothetical protein